MIDKIEFKEGPSLEKLLILMHCLLNATHIDYYLKFGKPPSSKMHWSLVQIDKQTFCYFDLL